MCVGVLPPRSDEMLELLVWPVAFFDMFKVFMSSFVSPLDKVTSLASPPHN